MTRKTEAIKNFMKDRLDIEPMSVEDSAYTFVFGIKDNHFIIGCTTSGCDEAALQAIPFTIKGQEIDGEIEDVKSILKDHNVKGQEIGKQIQDDNVVIGSDVNENGVISGLKYENGILSGVPILEVEHEQNAEES